MDVLGSARSLVKSVHCAGDVALTTPSESPAIAFEVGIEALEVGRIRAPARYSAKMFQAVLVSEYVAPSWIASFRLAPPSDAEPIDLTVSAAATLANVVLSSRPHDLLAYSVIPSCSDPDAPSALQKKIIEVRAVVPADAVDGDEILLLSVSIAGCAVPMSEPPLRAIVGFNHAPSQVGPVYAAARVGDIPALRQALACGGSTQEADRVRQLKRLKS